MEIGEFHNRDGWYFKRLPDGAVRIRKTVTPVDGAPVEHEHVIPPNEWASIIAHVSVRGDTGEGFALAESFHTGHRIRETDLFVLLNHAGAEERRAEEAEKRGDINQAKVRRTNAADLRSLEHRLL